MVNRALQTELREKYDAADTRMGKLALLMEYDKRFEDDGSKSLDLDDLIALEFLTIPEGPEREEALDLMSDEEQIRLAGLITMYKAKIERDNDALARRARINKMTGQERPARKHNDKLKKRRTKAKASRKARKKARH